MVRQKLSQKIKMSRKNTHKPVGVINHLHCSLTLVLFTNLDMNVTQLLFGDLVR